MRYFAVPILERGDFFNESVFEAQDEYTDEMITEALFDSYCDGPIFEAVTKSDKTTIKNITNHVRRPVRNILEDEQVHFCEAKYIFPLLMGCLEAALTVFRVRALNRGKPSFLVDKDAVANLDVDNIANLDIANMIHFTKVPYTGGAKVLRIANIIRSGYFAGTRLIGGIRQLFVARSYQTVGLAFFKKRDVNGTMEQLNEQCSDILNGYKLVAVPINKNIASLFQRIKAYKTGTFNFFAYLIIVDKGMPNNIDKEQNDVADAIEEVEKEDRNKNNSDVKEESVLDETYEEEVIDIFDENLDY